MLTTSYNRLKYLLFFIFILFIIDQDLYARGPRGRAVRRSGGGSSFSFSNSSSSHRTKRYKSHKSSSSYAAPAIPIEERLLSEYLYSKQKCAEDRVYIKDHCPLLSYEKHILCLEQNLKPKLISLKTYENKLKNFSYTVEEDLINANVKALRSQQSHSNESFADYECKAQQIRFTLGLSGFGVAPENYTPIQGKIIYPNENGLGLSFWFHSMGLYRIGTHQYLDFAFHYEYENIPLNQHHFGDNNDVSFSESLNWMMIDPLLLSYVISKSPAFGTTFWEIAYLRVDAGFSLVKSYLEQTITSNYDGGSDQIGQINAEVMSAWGVVLKSELFLPLYGTFGPLFFFQYRNYFNPSFSNGDYVLNKITFDDLIKNNGYQWSAYGIKLSNKGDYFDFDFGFQENQLIGSSGTRINHRTFMLSLSGSFYATKN